MISKLIVYACPTGQLADQIAAYYARSRAECGPNAAHAYPPHCTLTGFFHDDVESIPRYKNALAAALQRAKPQQPTPVITISDLVIDERFRYLQLDSPWNSASGAASNWASAPIWSWLRPPDDRGCAARSGMASRSI